MHRRGFCFVFLSASLGSVPWIMTLDASLRMSAYVLLWLMSFSIVLIGTALSSMLDDLGIGKLGSYGLFTLNTSLLIAYLYFVGAVIATDISFYGFEIRLLGPLAFFVILFIFVVVNLCFDKWKNKEF